MAFTTSSSLWVPNSFSSDALLAVSKMPWLPCLTLLALAQLTPLNSPHYPAIRLRGKRRQKRQGNSLVRDKDFPPAHNLCERNRRVLLPVLDGFRAVDEDDEVVVLALVVHLGLLVVSARHIDCLCGERGFGS
jgi:hypothetical protein